MTLPDLRWLASALLLALATAAPAAEECAEQFDSTFALIEKVIFERRGCTSATCHVGPLPAGELDLSPGVAYDNLVDHPAATVPLEQRPGLARVVPGFKGRSLLWLNLASATLPDLWQAPLRPMPIGGLAPLTLDELELVQQWIEHGAPRVGVVPGSGEAFDACLPPPKPLEVEPLAPPAGGLGVQLRAPHQVLPAESERETCFVSYYDLTDQVPAEFLSPDGTSFRYKRVDARQNPLSHHAVVIVYEGSTPITSPVWGAFACRGGSLDGQACSPTAPGACGADGVCASPPRAAPACIGFGPGDAGIGTGEETLFNTMGSAVDGSGGLYAEAPLKGILVWNSHAFNITDVPAGLDMWINFIFAPPAEQLRPLDGFVDISAITKMRAAAFGADEVCHHSVMPIGSQLLELTSHTHQRGKRFRVFAGEFACQGGARAGNPCSPFGPEPGFPVSDLCAGTPCTSIDPPRVGDCDGNLVVSIAELLRGVSLALDGAAADTSSCPRFDGNVNAVITVDELIGAVSAALNPALRDPAESLVYTNLTYADPQVRTFTPMRPMGGPSSIAAERTLTYCALYDNGFTDPQTVKRNSRVPTNGAACQPTHCAEGAVGARCTQDAQCDTTAGAGDGFCDACSVGFGLTTDDEMFVLIGSFVLD
ncbi:MAG: hypothetical protein ACRERC_00800 [Candidatus Binatia bacterium]